VFVYKDKSVNINEIDRELGVKYVLEGSVRKVGSRVRITAQLIDVKSEGHIWADRRPYKDPEQVVLIVDRLKEMGFH